MKANSNIYAEGLYSQIEEAYGKLQYTYTTQITEAERLAKKNSRLKWAQIILSAVSAGGAFGTIIYSEQYGTIASALCSTALLVLSAYFKDAELSTQEKKYLATSNKLWLIREKYISLLTDFDTLDESDIKIKRDELQQETSAVYNEAPITSPKNYSIARDKLKNKEVQYFSRDELNRMLPPHLRKSV